MKTLLIALFVILFIYLIIHMCAGSGERGAPIPTERGLDKTLVVLNGLQSLRNKDLSGLKDDLEDLKSLLDKGETHGDADIHRIDRRNPDARQKLHGKEILQKISKDLKKMDRRRFQSRGNAFSKFRVVLVEIALIVITILMIVL